MRAISLLGVMLSIFLAAGCGIPEVTPTPTAIPDSIPTPRIADTPTPVRLESPTPLTVDRPTPEGMTTPTPQMFQTRDGRTITQYAQPPQMTIDPEVKYTARIRTNLGEITVELLPSEAPVTVNNFVFLARQGFYDGVIFHRIIEGFMVQSGDPLGTGTGGPGYRFADEPVTREYVKGTLAMANAGPNTNGSQFFIVHGENVGLPPNYTIFGQVAEGLGVLDELARTPVQPNPATGEVSVPVDPPVIESIEITESP